MGYLILGFLIAAEVEAVVKIVTALFTKEETPND